MTVLITLYNFYPMGFIKLHNYIKNRQFPIIIQNKVEVDKLGMCIYYLNRLEMPYQLIDISKVKEQHKPLIPQLYIIHNIDDYNILEKLSYTNNIIIVSEVFINIKTQNIFMVSLPSNFGHINKWPIYHVTTKVLTEVNKLTITMLLKKIFNKKCTGIEIAIDNSKFIIVLKNIINSKMYGNLFFIKSNNISDEYHICKTFSVNNVLEGIYNYFLDFVTVQTFVEFYDILSLIDLNINQLITFCIYSKINSNIIKHNGSLIRIKYSLHYDTNE